MVHRHRSMWPRKSLNTFRRRYKANEEKNTNTRSQLHFTITMTCTFHPILLKQPQDTYLLELSSLRVCHTSVTFFIGGSAQQRQIRWQAGIPLNWCQSCCCWLAPTLEVMVSVLLPSLLTTDGLSRPTKHSMGREQQQQTQQSRCSRYLGKVV